MNSDPSRRARFWSAVAGALLMSGLIGCDGDTGRTGQAGPPGPPGGVVAGPVPTALQIDITRVSIGDSVVVDFQAFDQDGFAFAHLEQLSFTIAKLVPGTEGNSSAWQSYLNRVEEPGTGAWPGTETVVQATTESSSTGSLVNNGDGSYRYTFNTDLNAVSAPLAVEYEPELTHRVGLQVGGSFRDEPLPATNAVYTFQPSTDLMPIDHRKIVSQESCNNCHGQDLAMHGGSRVNVDYCVTCHNPGSTDAQSGHSLDFRQMIHKIHMGKRLPSVQNGGDYTIWGFRNSPHSYSDLAYPQDPRNCLTCHNPEDSATPQAINIVQKPAMESCGSCHDDIDFLAGVGHPATNNSECTICHKPGGFAGDVLASHSIPGQVAAKQFHFNLLEVMTSGQNEIPSVRFSVTDPTNDDAPYNILEDPLFGSGASLSIRIGWDTRDYVHGPAAGLSVTNVHQNATDNNDGTFTISAAEALPGDATGSGVVGMEGRAVDPDVGFQIPITGAVEYFAITDSEPVPRRQIVATQKCQACHSRNDALAFHGGQRTDEVQLCAICHNPNTTDLARRGGDTVVDGISLVDDLPEQSVHFKYMIHAIHGAEVRDEPYVAYGFGNTPHDFSDVRYPRSSGDCLACHTDDGYQLPLPNNVLGTSLLTEGNAADPSVHLKASEASAACGSCHTNNLAQTHMIQNGGVFDQTQNVLDASVTETCSVCHGPGQTADVKRVHGLP